MVAVASPEDEGDFAYADPLPYLEIINEQLQESGHEPIFIEKIKDEGYDLAKSFDFRDWPIIDSDGATEFHDGMFDVPESRIRVLGEKDGQLVHACYEKVMLPLTGTHAQIMSKAMLPQPFKWRVTYRTHSWDSCTCSGAKLSLLSWNGRSDLFHDECGRWRQSRVDGDIGEHIESLSLAPPDEMYNGFYPTIPGSDIAHHNPNATGMDEHRGGDSLMGSSRLDNSGNVVEQARQIRGGREIRNGRAEYRKATEGLIAWDSGTQAHLDRLKSDEAKKRKAQNRERVEKIVAQAPPSSGWE